MARDVPRRHGLVVVSVARFSGTIRPLAEADKDAWAPLWAGYLEFYETSLDPAISELTFARLLDSGEAMFALAAEQDGRVVGITHCIPHATTWASGPYVYLNDLFVAAEARGSGVGRALIEAVYAEAGRLGAARVYWLTHESNETARLLYDKVAKNHGFIQYQFLPPRSPA